MSTELNAYAKPPEELRPIFKRFQRAKAAELDADEHLLDLSHPRTLRLSHRTKLCQRHGVQDTQTVFQRFLGCEISAIGMVNCYEIANLPGLHVIPSLLPPDVQVSLLDRLLHRDLVDPQHKTNVHLHYDVQYPSSSRSFFSSSPESSTKFAGLGYSRTPLTLKSFLEKKLRWTTLGGQYDWTAKRYPDEDPPRFPSDIADLIQTLFPDMRAEAAIVNLYSPSDTLSLHRDVSEECGRPLVSISLGCDAIFLAALTDDAGKLQHTAMRLRSGDAVYMSGASRYAWHGVPQVISGTCPDWLSDWPAPEFEAWKGWMSNKRVNLNVRQMYD